SRNLPHFSTWSGIGYDFMGLGVYTPINMTSGPSVLGNRIQVINRAITTVGASYVTGVRFKQQESSTMALGAEGVLFDGNSHSASGQARLRGVELVQVPHPRLENIGSSGQDGVIIRPLPYGLRKQVQMEPRAIALSLRGGGGGLRHQSWTWDAKASSGIAGGDETISSVSLDLNGSTRNWTVSPPSPWLVGSTINVRVMIAEKELGFGGDLNAGIVATSLVSLVPDTYEFELLVDPAGNPTGVVHRVTWDTPHDIAITGQASVLGDTIETEMVALTLRSSGPIDFELDSLEFLVTSTSGETVVDILDEVVTWVDVCPGDTNASGATDVEDLLDLLAAWGPCPAPCPTDIDGDNDVDVEDLLDLLAGWGACP
ncbi:MAG: hypothetical protein O7G85_13310, partial [Planctomycetota bacterium]|nr:hypothetical protein [Planctomycetota bacterium]